MINCYRIGLIAALSFLFGGCAEPKYERIVQNPIGTSNQSEKFQNCRLRFKNGDHCLEWNWEKQPTSSDAGSLTFKVSRANLLDQSLIPTDIDGSLAVVLWMPSMGHGSVPTQVERVDVGSFRATNVFFIMPGEWEIKFQIRNGNQVVDEAAVNLTR